MNKKLFLSISLICIFVLASCSAASPTVDPNTVYTAAAQTVAVQLTTQAALNPSATVALTNTLQPSLSPSPSNTMPIAPLVTNTPLATPSITMAAVADKGEWVSQVPVDETTYNANQSFTVTWTIKNTGPTIWNTNYQVRFFSGERMGPGLANSYNFPGQTIPNDSAQISVQMIAPAQAGKYTSNWVLTNKDGGNFYAVYVTIKVGTVAATGTVTPTATVTVVSVAPTMTETPTSTPTTVTTP